MVSTIRLAQVIPTPPRNTYQKTHLSTVWAEAKVLHRLSRVLRSSQQQRICPGRRPQSKLIQGQALSSSLLDPRSRSRRESQCCYGQLWDCEQARVVGNGADDNEGLLRSGESSET